VDRAVDWMDVVAWVMQCDRMENADGKSDLKDEVYAIVGCAFAVFHELGNGGEEMIYQSALCAEFRAREIAYVQQGVYPVYYKGEEIGALTPDLVVNESVIVEAKVIPEITDRERWSLLHQLRATGCRVGVIFNYYNSKLEWQRLTH
jgi:GxxExxY protein